MPGIAIETPVIAPIDQTYPYKDLLFTLACERPANYINRSFTGNDMVEQLRMMRANAQRNNVFFLYPTDTQIAHNLLYGFTWNMLRDVTLFCIWKIKDCPNSPGLKQVLTVPQWFDYIAGYDPKLPGDQQYTFKQVIEFCSYCDGEIFTGMNDSEKELYITRAKTTPKAKKDLLYYISVATKYVALAGIVKMVSEILPSNAITDPIKDAVTEATNDLFTADGLANLGSQVIADTVKDKLNDVRSDVMDEVKKLDESSDLNLSAVTDAFASNTAKIVREVSNAFEDGTRELITNILDKASATDTALTEPESQEHAAMLDLNKAVGAGFISALDKYLFVRGTA